MVQISTEKKRFGALKEYSTMCSIYVLAQ